MSYPILRRSIFPLLRLYYGKIEGLDNLPHGPYIIAINHVGSIDYFFILAVLSQVIPGCVHGIGQSERWRDYMAKRWWQCIIIDPNDKNRCLTEAQEYLVAGEVCAIFPEGRASRNNPELLPGKSGLARLALRTGVPVVPVGFIGPWGAGSFRGTLRNFIHYFKKTELHVGQPMTFTKVGEHDITKKVIDETTRSAMTAIASLCYKTYPY